MIIATLWEQHISIRFSYLPAWELFASMHVLQQPLHHEEQQEFVRRVEAGHAELVAEMREWTESPDGRTTVLLNVFEDEKFW